MRKPKRMPTGIYFRGLAICARFALPDGSMERRKIGPASQVSVREAEHQRYEWMKQVREGTYTRKPAAPVQEPTTITVADLWDPYLTSYKNNGGRAAWRQEISWVHLKPMFETMPVGDVTTQLVGEYIAARQAAGMSNATINREVTLLRAMFNMGARLTPPMVERIPYFGKKLKEAAPRKGFVNDAQYAVLKRNAKHLWLRALLALFYSFGSRRGEMLDLKVEQVNPLDREIRLYEDDTKNGEPRVIPMTSEVYQLMVECCRGKSPNDFALTWDGTTEPINPNGTKFRDEWKALVEASGLPGLLRHDFRRAALRGMTRRGIPQRVAMEISGHKTISTFLRYDIVDATDLRAAVSKLEKPLATDTKVTHAVYEQN